MEKTAEIAIQCSLALSNGTQCVPSWISVKRVYCYSLKVNIYLTHNQGGGDSLCSAGKWLS